jgi:hypothetical protein
MIKTLLDKIYAHKFEEEKEAVLNILMTNITDLQMKALYEIDSEVSETIAEIMEPPDADEVAAKNPTMDTGFEE